METFTNLFRFLSSSFTSTSQRDAPLIPFVPVALPTDQDGYVISFDSKESDQIKAFFDEFGFVVIRDVLTKEEVEQSIQEIWDVELISIDRTRPNTWRRWPGLASVGLLGFDIAQGAVAFRNRLHPRLYESFAAVVGTPHLNVAIDRYGVMYAA
jgi:hypothetical protein